MSPEKTTSSADEATVEIASPSQLSACLAIRRRVFIEELGIDESIELDDEDSQAIHFVARIGDFALGTARLRIIEGQAKAERVAVLAANRRAGIGERLMHAMESKARERGHRHLALHAQESAISFYLRLGYRPEGEKFYEAGIPHQTMSKTLTDGP
jgi:predicted GNAT family N-acyltransferase